MPLALKFVDMWPVIGIFTRVRLVTTLAGLIALEAGRKDSAL